jgi:hypothetical protein
MVNIRGTSIKGPITVDTPTIGLEANAVKAIAIANSKLRPVQWKAVVAESA